MLENYFLTVAFLVSNSVYVFVRVATLAIASLIFLYGLSQVESEFDYATGNFNIPAIRFSALIITVVFQAYLSYVFIKRQIKRARENAIPVQVAVKSKQKSKKKEGEKSSCCCSYATLHVTPKLQMHNLLLQERNLPHPRMTIYQKSIRQLKRTLGLVHPRKQSRHY